MVEALVRGLLGPLSGLLDFILDNPILISGILAVWLGIFVAGKLQLQNIERKTVELVLGTSPSLIAAKPHITSRGLYKRIYPRWETSLRQWGWFIPHRMDLWPVPITPETVRQKLPFSYQWIAEILAQHGIQVEG
ncbi:MAG TPA: hypothetical protein G4N98_09195 [Thermoflexia bacterium]|nr:hypothetical protein [Thermoflexia bacterium]